MNFDAKKIRAVILVIFAVEAVSFLGYLYPLINKLGFLAIIIAASILTFRKLEFGIWFVFTELFIGSKGYLFYYDWHGLNFPIRIALWLIIMSVWTAGIIIGSFRQRSVSPVLAAFWREIRQRSNKYLALLAILVVWGIANGLRQGNDYANIFFDFNNWFYFLLVFPLFAAIDRKEKVADLFSVLSAALLSLGLKTIALLFIFSHELTAWIYPLYRWVRTTGVGEITQVQGGFYRVFFQSHIYHLLAFFILAVLLASRLGRLAPAAWFKDAFFKRSFVVLSFFFVVILLSFSRSFWIGLAAGLFLLLALSGMFFSSPAGTRLKKTAVSVLVFSASAIAAAGLIVIMVKFPYPRPLGGFDASALFSDRLTRTSEAAASSRWELLPKLWSRIVSAPILGHGFGALVTYRSYDPRLTELPDKGIFTTYAFEWGWLDIWLKLGIFGLLTYLCLIATIIRDAFLYLRQSELFPLYSGLAIGLAVLSLVNFFTPYLNHPLGIGYLIMVMAVIRTDVLLKAA